MLNRFRKILIALILVMLLGVLAFQSVLADKGGGTPQELVERGWVCLYRFDKYAYCMNPDFAGLGKTAIMNKTFLVSDSDFSNPEYLGTSIFLSADVYADQPCPTNTDPDWVLVLGGLYYQCRHFEQDYP